VRELHNAVEYAFALGAESVLGVTDLPPELRGEAPPSHRSPGAEREQIRRALEQAGGRKGEAAQSLGISRSTLWRKLKQHGLG